jgi:hypothetical protein
LTLEHAISNPDLLNRAPSYINYHYEYIDAFLARYPETEEELARWLRFPLLPSTGYFGADFYGGILQRHRKLGRPEEWLDDEYFGWGGLDLETIEGPRVSLEQRPSQVREVAVDAEGLSWEPVATADGAPVRYRVVASARSRGWEYDVLPVGCTFAVDGDTAYVDEPRISLCEVRRGGGFVTIFAVDPTWGDRDIFYLPSREIFID